MNQQKTRLMDIALRLGVSKVTVSAVLSPKNKGNVRVSSEMAEKIRKTAIEMNYKPNFNAKMLAGCASRVIGILIDSQAPISRLKILASIEREAALHGYRCMIAEAHDSLVNLRHNYDIFMQYGVDGVICFAHSYPETEIEFRNLFADAFDKMVFIGTPNHSDASYVHIDRITSTIQSIKHLHLRGARKIAFIRGQKSWEAVRQREIGYCKAMHELGYKEEEYIILVDHSMDMPRAQQGSAAEKLLLDYVIPQKIDAIFGLNDLAALAFLQAMQKNSKHCQLDIKVIGYDNDDFSPYVTPALTTVDEDNELQTKLIIDLLLKKITNTDSTLTGCFASVIPKLIERSSS